MKTSHKLGLAALVGGLAGAVGTSAIYAQQVKAPPAYIISEADVITDSTAIQQYGQAVGKTLAPFDGHYHFIVGGAKIDGLDGEAPQGVVVIAFDAEATARAWYDSPSYQAIKPIRQSAVKGRMYIAQGFTPR